MRAHVVAVLALALAACGRAQWREVDARLQEAAAPARAAGYAPLAGRNNEFGAFADSAATHWTLALDSGRSYYLAAACSGPCRAVDLAIDLEGGTGLVRDSSARTDARLSFIAPRTGSYPVTLRIAACAGGTCRWAAQLYAAPR